MILMMNRNQDHDGVREAVGRTEDADDKSADTDKGPIQKDFLLNEFQPGEWDVICHSGKDPKSHVGNRRFKILIQNYLSSYVKAESRILKSAVISDIISVIRSKSKQNGGFVRYDESERRWYEVGDKVARDKVGHSLREAMKAANEGQLEQARAAVPEVAASGSSIDAMMSVSSSIFSEKKSAEAMSMTSSIFTEKKPAAVANIDTKSTSSSSNMGTISGETQSYRGEATPVAMNLVDWFEEDSNIMEVDQVDAVAINEDEQLM